MSIMLLATDIKRTNMIFKNFQGSTTLQVEANTLQIRNANVARISGKLSFALQSMNVDYLQKHKTAAFTSPQAEARET